MIFFSPKKGHVYTWPVVQIDDPYDGDSCWCTIDRGSRIYSRVMVRLWRGINAPEIATRDLDEKAAAIEVRRVVSLWIAASQEKGLMLRSDEQDSRGRLLGDLYYCDGTGHKSLTTYLWSHNIVDPTAKNGKRLPWKKERLVEILKIAKAIQ